MIVRRRRLTMGAAAVMAMVMAVAVAVAVAFSVSAPADAGAPSADLGVTITDTPDPVAPGDNITYTITVVNNGPQSSAGFNFDIPVPAGTTFVSLTAPPGSIPTTPPAGGTGSITAIGPTLAVAGTAEFTLVINVNPDNSGSVSLLAIVSAFEVDPATANNTDTELTLIVAPSADLAVTVADAPDPVAPGANVTYTITATNAGPDDATSTSLVVPVPSGTTFVSFTAPAGWTITTPPVGGTGTVTATNPTFTVAASPQVFTLVVNVDPGTTGAMSTTATISAATLDPAGGNNADTEATSLVLPTTTTSTTTTAPTTTVPSSSSTTVPGTTTTTVISVAPVTTTSTTAPPTTTPTLPATR